MSTGNGHALPLVCDCGHEGLELMWHASDCPIKRGTALPSLADVISDARRTLQQAIQILGHQRDMTSYPVEGDGLWPWIPGKTDRLLGNVVANIRVALEELEYLASELPAVSSASPIPPVHVPGPPLADALDEGDGPPSHRLTPSGECPQPGSAAVFSGAVSESPGGPPSPGAGETLWFGPADHPGRGGLPLAPGAGDSFSLPVPPSWHWLNTK